MEKSKVPSKFRVAAEEIVPNRFSRKSYTYSILAVLIMLVLIGGFWVYMPSEVPLFFSKPWGETRLGSKALLLIIPGLSILVSGVNLILQKLLKIENEFVNQFIAGSSLAISVMFLVSVLYILMAVL